MTDKQTLCAYRLAQAEETLLDARKMLQNNLSPRSIINRAYYAMFYAVLALFLRADINIKTSKHTGVISIFDKEVVHTGKIDTYYSKIFHKTFVARQVGDYKEFVVFSPEDAAKFVKFAEEFFDDVKKFVDQGEHR